MVLLMAGTLGGFYLYLQYLIDSQQREGFSPEDLMAPLHEERPLKGEERPLFISPGPTPSFSCKLYWPVNASTKMLDGYAGIGAVLNISLRNTGTADLYVERVRVSSYWGAQASGEVGKYVRANEERYLRHLLLDIPDPPPAPGNRTYTVSMDLLINDDTTWIRKTDMDFDPSTVNILQPSSSSGDPKMRLNNAYYFDKVSQLIDQDREVIGSLVENSTLGEGAYTIQKVCDVYEYVISSLEYIPDPVNGENQWTSPASCLSRGGGDCEDYAVLFASLMEAVGGSARVIITSSHAFNAVYIGEDTSSLSSIEERYGLEIPFQIYEDELGKWLIIEPQSYLVFGWFPLDVSPTTISTETMYLYGDNDLGWEFVNSDDIYIVDIYFK